MTPPGPWDVCIVGAGIVGCALARELARYRLRIVLVERSDDVGSGATKANSGIVHGAYSSPHGTIKAAMCAAGARMVPRLDGELAFGYRRTGALVLAFSPAERQELAALEANGRANGDAGLELLTPVQVSALEPRLNTGIAGALLCPDVGVASPYEMAIALAENAVANGVELRLGSEVTAIALETGQDGSRLFKVEATAGDLAARFVVNAAGVYSDRVAALVGEPGFRILPRQGQYVLFEKGTGAAVSRVIFQVPTERGKGILVTSTYHGNLMIGPNANEIHDPDDASTSLEVLEQIVATARRSLPDFDLRQVITTYSGVRATSDTKDFVIRRGPAPGFVTAGGIDSPGLTSAPAHRRAPARPAGRRGTAPRSPPRLRPDTAADHCAQDALGPRGPAAAGCSRPRSHRMPLRARHRRRDPRRPEPRHPGADPGRGQAQDQGGHGQVPGTLLPTAGGRPSRARDGRARSRCDTRLRGTARLKKARPHTPRAHGVGFGILSWAQAPEVAAAAHPPAGRRLYERK